MRSVLLLSLIYVLSSIPYFTVAAPSDKKPTPKGIAPPEETIYPKEGEFVGVRVGKYEAKKPTVGKKIMTTPHPGIVVGVPPSDPGGVYKVAMISKNHPHNPPQAPINNFIANAQGIYGSVKLTSEDIPQTHLRSWKNSKTGEKQLPLDSENLKKLKKQMEPHKNWVPPKTPSPEPEEILKHKPAYQYSGKHTSSHASSSNSRVHSGSNQGGGTAGAPIKRPAVHVPHLGPSSSSGSGQKIHSQHSASQHLGPKVQLHAGGSSSSTSSSSHHPQQQDHSGSRHPGFTQPQRHPQTAPNSQTARHGRKSPPAAHAYQRPQHQSVQHNTVHQSGHTTWAHGAQDHGGANSNGSGRPPSPSNGSHRPKSQQSWRRPQSPSRSPPRSPRPKSPSSSRPPSPNRAWSSRPKVPGHSHSQHDQKKFPPNSQHGTSGSRHPPKEKRFVGIRR